MDKPAAKEPYEPPDVVRVKLVPKEVAWEAYRKHYPRPDDLSGLTENPLPDKLEIVAASPKHTLRVADQVRALPGVDEVKEGRQVLRTLMAIAGVVRMGGIVLALVLALGTAAIISNAIRLTLFARRRDIRVMQLVGATNGFIRVPFVLEGMAEGALGGLLACGVLAGALHYFAGRVLPNMPFVNELRLTMDLPLFWTSLIVGGALLGFFGSLASLRRFLQAS